MCGIAGRLQFDASRPVDAGLLAAMGAALAHRGPDDSGLFVRRPVGLAHRRLAILDLSPAGHQPMPNDDRTVWIVFNGEIYNCLELRQELEREGDRFRSRSDTEVLLRAYERHGVDCLARLRGMFAFAIWDARLRRLFLARDRLGVKPLFYRLTAHSLTFASELKALLADPEFERRVDPVAVHHYLTYQYVPSSHCAFEGVAKLPPGHFMLAERGAVQVRRWWKLSYAPKVRVRSPRQLRDLEHELVARLEEAVRIRLLSDVPVGAFLSGGVDSSAIVGLMSRMAERPVRTFSVGFDEEPYDELPAARVAARCYHTEHTEIRVRPAMLDLLPRLARCYDEPYADASAVPTFLVAERAAKDVKVVLTGDAGDENFAGYDRYVANELARRLRSAARFLGSRGVRSLLAALPHGDGPSNLVWRLKRFLEHVAQPPEARNAGWLTRFDAYEKERLYSGVFADRVGPLDSRELVYERNREAEGEDFLDTVLYADVMTYLPDCLLVKADIATMAHGLEARSPFLDHRFMEFAARIPSRLKLRGHETKWILKRALRGHVPASLLGRPKRGFNLPLDMWLRGELREFAADLLLSARSLARGYFRPAFIRRMLDEHQAGRWNWQDEIWTLMMLELWQREVAGRARAPLPAAAALRLAPEPVRGGAPRCAATLPARRPAPRLVPRRRP